MKVVKTLSLSMFISLLFSMRALSAQGVISFSDPTVDTGSEVNVTMKISADEGTALSSANVVLTYPSDSLEFISGTDAEGGAGAIRVHGVTNGYGTSLLEYNLRFRTSVAGTFAIGIDSYEVYDSNDQPIEFTHLGNSAVSVVAEADASANAALKSLEIYPGVLEPAFSQDNNTYNVTVGLGVDRLTINAITEDDSASVRIANNDKLPEGDSSVIITVNAADGVTSSEYVINVSKVEGGPESNIATAPEQPEGVQLSSKGKTITIMNPDETLEVPEGFRKGTIKIDDQKVQGWIWGSSEEPEYCVVYGMNDKGELNFYRYDMVEKTIQRYFEDPLAAGAVSASEYDDLMRQKDAAENSAEVRLIIIIALAVIAFIAVMTAIYLWFKLRTTAKMRDTYRKQSQAAGAGEHGRGVRTGQNSDDTKGEGSGQSGDFGSLDSDGLKDMDSLFKHDYKAEPEESPAEEADETMVIKRPDRKRRARRYIKNGAEGGGTDSIADLDEQTGTAEGLNITGNAGERDAAGNTKELDAAGNAGERDIAENQKTEITETNRGNEITDDK